MSAESASLEGKVPAAACARRGPRPEFARAAAPASGYSYACRVALLCGALNRTGLTLAVSHADG